MNEKTNAALSSSLDNLDEYRQLRTLVHTGDYSKALTQLDNSKLNDSTKTHLQRALESKDTYIINRTFGELDARIMQALCWDCWKE